MARGRMISKTLSTSERFASLHDIAGKLAEFCQSLYPLLVAHADDWGCLHGDVFTVKHLVLPTSPRRLSEFETALKALHNAKLITWYRAPDDDGEHAGRWVIYIRGFAAHQVLKGHTLDGRKRTLPEPPENPSDFAYFAQSRPRSPKSALTELNLREEKRTYTEPKGTGADAPAEVAVSHESDPDLDTGHVTNADVGAFLRRFCELYAQHRHRARYLVKRDKDVPRVRLLLATYPRDRLEKLATVLLTTDDEWVAGTDRGIGILTVKASWLDGLLADYEARHGAIAVAMAG